MWTAPNLITRGLKIDCHTLLRKLDFTPFTLEIETPDVQLLTLKSYYQWLKQLEHIIQFFLPFSKLGKKFPKLETF